MAKYRRKSKEIEAFQYDGDFMNSNGEYYVPEWAVEALKIIRQSDGIISACTESYLNDQYEIIE